MKNNKFVISVHEEKIVKKKMKDKSFRIINSEVK